MHLGQKTLSVKRKYFGGLILLLFGCAICMAFGTTGSEDFEISRREVILHNIGHQLLLQSGDSTSRVLPVENVSSNEYQIRFEKAFTFKTDYLVNITRQLLAKDPLTYNYIVNVMNGSNTSVTYGYAISQNKKDDIVPCRGRVQPTAPYRIGFKFEPTGITTAKNKYILSSLPFLAFVGFIVLRSVKQPKAPTNDVQNGIFYFGSVLFDPQQKQLTINKETVGLTGTETRLLHIFASLPNQTITRTRLQKEIWEDEGVIVGRSLDMFISKLRKKLELDPNSNIVVVRGKGYQLQISS